MDVAKQVLVTQTSWENGAFKIRFVVGKMNIGNTYQTETLPVEMKIRSRHCANRAIASRNLDPHGPGSMNESRSNLFLTGFIMPRVDN
jgi:hypothetical protein